MVVRGVTGASCTEFSGAARTSVSGIGAGTRKCSPRVGSCGKLKVADAVVLGCFFFQAEDGIRDGRVTGVQTCALPISQASGILLRRGGGAPRAAARSTPRARSNRPPDHVRDPCPPGSLRPSHDAGMRICLLGMVLEIGRASCRERGEMWVGAGSC